MKIKSKARDFRVRELLDERYLRPRGRFRVYLVTKTKLTSLEAAATLADMAGVSASAVGIAGLKDRQGVTTQYMSVPSKKPVYLRTPSLRIEPAGFAEEELSSRASSGNGFELTLRGVSRPERAALETALVEVEQHGIPNYFGEQRFGNLRYNQGWIARDLALGAHEQALKDLLCARSENDNERNRKFKAGLTARWGEWRICRDIAGKFGAHHSIFEYLARNEGDFAGAFRHVSSRLRLIHLYAWQSHLWNRAVARYIEEITAIPNRIEVATPEGRLFFSRVAMPVDPSMENAFRLPGEKLADVVHPRQRELLAQALAREGMKPEQYKIEGIPGFQLKGEDRALVIHPQKLRLVEEREETRAGERPAMRLGLSFELPRGAYATLVLQRLLESERQGRPRDHEYEPEREARRGPQRDPRPGSRPDRSPGRSPERGQGGPGRRGDRDAKPRFPDHPARASGPRIRHDAGPAAPSDRKSRPRRPSDKQRRRPHA